MLLSGALGHLGLGCANPAGRGNLTSGSVLDFACVGLRRLGPLRCLSVCQDAAVERVLGIGGYFLRASDPVALSAWYRQCLGLDADEHGVWRQADGPTVFATMESATDYFGSREQQTMLNFRVGDLEAMLVQLRSMGANVVDETQEMQGLGRFGWVIDPEGNRVELWEPA